MPFNLSDLSEAILRFVAENVPGRTPLRFHIYTVEDGGEPISLPIVGGIAAGAGVSFASSEEETHGAKVSKCVVDIIEVLERAGRPLATTALLAALARAGKEWSRSHVEKLLAEMVRDGTLENPDDARPRGYRLPLSNGETATACSSPS